MTEHNVTVHTVREKGGRSKVNEAWMHVDSEYGYVGVHTTTSNPTFLIGNEIVIYFMQFSDLDWARDYITYHQAYIDWIKLVFYDEGTVHVRDVDYREYLLDTDDPAYPGRLDEKVHDGERKMEMEELLGYLYTMALDGEDADNIARVQRITELLRELS